MEELMQSNNTDLNNNGIPDKFEYQESSDLANFKPQGNAFDNAYTSEEQIAKNIPDYRSYQWYREPNEGYFYSYGQKLENKIESGEITPEMLPEGSDIQKEAEQLNDSNPYNDEVNNAKVEKSIDEVLKKANEAENPLRVYKPESFYKDTHDPDAGNTYPDYIKKGEKYFDPRNGGMSILGYPTPQTLVYDTLTEDIIDLDMDLLGYDENTPLPKKIGDNKATYEFIMNSPFMQKYMNYFDDAAAANARREQQGIEDKEGYIQRFIDFFRDTFEGGVEEAIENNPDVAEQAMEVVAGEDSPIETEAEQLNDSNPHNDEVNNKAVDDFLKKVEKNPKQLRDLKLAEYWDPYNSGPGPEAYYRKNAEAMNRFLSGEDPIDSHLLSRYEHPFFEGYGADLLGYTHGSLKKAMDLPTILNRYNSFNRNLADYLNIPNKIRELKTTLRGLDKKSAEYKDINSKIKQLRESQPPLEWLRRGEEDAEFGLYKPDQDKYFSDLRKYLKGEIDEFPSLPRKNSEIYRMLDKIQPMPYDYDGMRKDIREIVSKLEPNEEIPEEYKEAISRLSDEDINYLIEDGVYNPINYYKPRERDLTLEDVLAAYPELKDPEKLEEAIENNPRVAEVVEETLPESNSLDKEIDQIVDNNPHNDEVNNKAVDDEIEEKTKEIGSFLPAVAFDFTDLVNSIDDEKTEKDEDKEEDLSEAEQLSDSNLYNDEVVDDIKKDIDNEEDLFWFEQLTQKAKKGKRADKKRKREENKNWIENQTSEDLDAIKEDFGVDDTTATMSGDVPAEIYDKENFGGKVGPWNNAVGPARNLSGYKDAGESGFTDEELKVVGESWLTDDEIDDIVEESSPNADEETKERRRKILKKFRLATIKANPNFPDVNSTEIKSKENPGIKSGVHPSKLNISKGGGTGGSVSGMKISLPKEKESNYKSKTGGGNIEVEVPEKTNTAKFSGSSNSIHRSEHLSQTMDKIGKSAGVIKTGSSSLSGKEGHTSSGKAGKVPFINKNLNVASIREKIIGLSKGWPMEKGYRYSGPKYLPFKFWVKDDAVELVQVGTGRHRQSLESFIKKEPRALQQLMGALK